MGWTVEQLLKHPHSRTLLGVPAPKAVPTPPAPAVAPPVTNSKSLTFTVAGPVVGKPRMTQSDKWKKRPPVLRYRDYCDRIRAAAGQQLENKDIFAISVLAFIGMPASWSRKKKAGLDNDVCRAKPDWDNIGKAVCDALFANDEWISDGRVRKYWCHAEQQRTEITVYWA